MRAKNWVATGIAVAVVAVAGWTFGGRAGGDGGGARAAGEQASPVRDGATGAKALSVPLVTGTRPVRIDLTPAMLRRAVADGRFDVAPAGGPRYAVEQVREQREAGANWSVIGRVDTAAGPQSMVLTVGPDAVFGILPRPDGSQFHVTTTRGVVSIARAGDLVPPGHRGAPEPDYVIPADPPVGASPGGESAPVLSSAEAATATSSSPTEIVVLGLYTENLVTLRGSVSAAETEVTNLFAISNQAHVDSLTGIVFRVAGLRQVVSDEAKTNSTVLSDITNNRVDGVDLVALRDSLSADLVALVRPYNSHNGSCGVAWLSGSRLSAEFANPAYGFSVNNVAPCSPFVVAHELGHNLGSMHDITTSTTNGAVDYGAYVFSFGYRQNGPPSFATIMAYTTAGQPRIGYFSAPELTGCGAPCGVAEEADNARSQRLMASRIASFRAAPGTISILDGDRYEPDPGFPSSMPRIVVRYSGVAPADGVRFGISIGGGSALAGTDYSMPSQTTYVIPAGQSEVSLSLDVLADTVIEPDETVEVRLVDVVGATVLDGLGIVTIRNDDPRLTVAGQVRFPAGMTPPTAPFQVFVGGVNGDGANHSLQVSPPDFAYRLPVVSRANLSLYAQAPAPYVGLPLRYPGIRRSAVLDLLMHKGLQVSGQLRVPEGGAAPTSSLWLDLTSSVAGVRQVLPSVQLSPPDFKYSVWVVPGAWVSIGVTPATPYLPFRTVNTRLTGDWVQDIQLSTLPTLYVWDQPAREVRGAGANDSYAPTFQLTAPAPPGGVRVRYATVDGTASAGSDYTAASGVIDIPEGQRSAQVSIPYAGDDVVEGEEWFELVVSEPSGAQLVTPRVVLRLAEPDRYMGGPAQRVAGD